MADTISSLLAAAEAVNANGLKYREAADTLNNEIGNFAQAGGQLDPTKNIGTRMMRAARSGALHFNVDVSATLGRVTLTPALPHTEYTDGLPFVVKLSRKVTKDTVVNVSGLGDRPLVLPGNMPLSDGDFDAGDLMPIVYNAGLGKFVTGGPVSGGYIRSLVTKTVYGVGADFADLNAAMAWLAQRRVMATGGVIFNLARGKWGHAASITLQHPDLVRCTIVGAAMLAAFPTYSSLTFTGNTPAARAADAVTNIAMARARWQTELTFTGGASLAIDGNLGNLQDLLLTGDGTAASGLTLITGRSVLTRIAIAGFGGNGLYALYSVATVNGGLVSFGNGAHGVILETASAIVFNDNVYAFGNGLNGLTASGASFQTNSPTAGLGASGNGGIGVCARSNGSVTMGLAGTAQRNGSHGVAAMDNSYLYANQPYLSDNVGYGAYSSSNSAASIPGVGGINNAQGALGALDVASIRCSGYTIAGTFSPAVNTNGNNNSYIAA